MGHCTPSVRSSVWLIFRKLETSSFTFSKLEFSFFIFPCLFSEIKMAKISKRLKSKKTMKAKRHFVTKKGRRLERDDDEVLTPKVQKL